MSFVPHTHPYNLFLASSHILPYFFDCYLILFQSALSLLFTIRPRQLRPMIPFLRFSSVVLPFHSPRVSICCKWAHLPMKLLICIYSSFSSIQVFSSLLSSVTSRSLPILLLHTSALGRFHSSRCESARNGGGGSRGHLETLDLATYSDLDVFGLLLCCTCDSSNVA